MRRRKDVSKKACALLWDESFSWGLMAWRALKEEGLPFELVRSEDVRRGALSHYRMLYVPGGWASNKISILGDRGQEEIRLFVEAGGSYLGICGGAGMAIEEGIGLLPIRRKPTADRVPSFSGPVRLALASYRIWEGIERPVFFVWWPSQFEVRDKGNLTLASYEEAMPDAFSSDISVADGQIIGWPVLEMRYGILLDPSRLRGEPAILEGHYGRGNVVLSLVHFDTPGDRNGAAVLRNLWDYLAPGWSFRSQSGKVLSGSRTLPDLPEEVQNAIKEIQAAVAELISYGARNFLWYWRNSLLLQWRRGVRGLEYGTLAVMIGEIVKILECLRSAGLEGWQATPEAYVSLLRKDLLEIRDRLIPFVKKAKSLVLRERLYMNTACLSPMECDDEEINCLRQELFGSTMSHGGHFKHLIDAVDRLLYRLIK